MNVKNQVCKWYEVCPIKLFVENGKLDRRWVEEYCLIGNKDCVRYHLEESGKTHPDNLLPNGDIKNNLS
ncbi:MAG: uracil-DNA glycosylase [Promethearchaeota archaeon]